MMQRTSISSMLSAGIGAVLSSLCCLLPLAVILLGLGSGAFMAVTMRYQWLLIPAGVFGVGLGFALYVRERRRCHALRCRMAWNPATLVILIAASLVVATTIALYRFPAVTSDLILWARGEAGSGSTEGKGM